MSRDPRHPRPKPAPAGQASLLDPIPAGPASLLGHRDGRTYNPEQDRRRLNRQALAVYGCLRDGAWWTLAQVAEVTGAPEASVSARIRDLRKPRFGGHIVDRRRVDGGLYAYRLAPKEPR